MSRFAQNGNGVRTELFGSASSDETCVSELLEALAKYPTDYKTSFSEWDTIDVGQPIDRQDSPFVGLLLASPEPWDTATVGCVKAPEGTVLFHRIVGLYKSELEFAKDSGGEAVWNLIRAGEEPLLDLSRAPVV